MDKRGEGVGVTYVGPSFILVLVGHDTTKTKVVKTLGLAILSETDILRRCYAGSTSC